MDTTKSDIFVKDWKNGTRTFKRGAFTVQKNFKVTSKELFALLCPTTELDWIPHWKCELLHSISGYAEYNAVFKTTFFGTEEVWVCTRYELNKAIDYARWSKDLTSKLDIHLTDNCDGTVTGRWVVTASALTEEGNKLISKLEKGKKHLETVLDGLDYYIRNGIVVSK